MQRIPQPSSIELLFQNGQYQEVISVLREADNLDTRQTAMLGIALLRTGQFVQSELPLAKAMALGDSEANVEYGNLLRATTQNQKAVRHFEKVLPELKDELRYRALRWYGVALYNLGDQRGLEMIEEARLGYLVLGNQQVLARISHTLAALHLAIGNFQKAKHLLEVALPVLEADQNPRPLLNAYNTLIDVQLEIEPVEHSHELIRKAQSLVTALGDPYAQLQLDSRKLARLARSGDYTTFFNRLPDLRTRANELGAIDVYTFVSNNLANHLSRLGQHASALRIMAELKQKRPDQSLETLMVSALLTLRRGDAQSALEQLLKVREQAQDLGSRIDATKALLLASLAAYRMNDLPTALTHLTEALSELAGWPAGQVQTTLHQEIQELDELLNHARLTPELRPIITAALEHTATLIEPQNDDLFLNTPLLELNVLGDKPLAVMNGEPCELRLTFSVAVLTYLAMQPDRSRHEITADLWGDHDPKKAAHSFRQCLMDIRRACGPDIIVMSGAHQAPRYALSNKVTTNLDSKKVLQLLEQGNVPAAISTYKGPFLARLPETDWITQHRDELVHSLTFSLRSSLIKAQSNQDHQAVILTTSTILAINPDDFEAEELRLEAARKVSPPTEVARFLAERNKRLN